MPDGTWIENLIRLLTGMAGNSWFCIPVRKGILVPVTARVHRSSSSIGLDEPFPSPVTELSV
jgi:hypothetical protein